MKKFLVLFLSIVIVISLVACAKQPADDPLPTGDGTTAATTTVTTTVAATKKEGTPQKPFGNISSGGGGDPPPMFYFDQPEDFPKFVAAASKTEEEFEEYYNTEIHTEGRMIYPSEREPVAHNMEIVYLPVTSDDVTVEGFGADYNLYSNMLDIIYRIDGVSYRFTYEYNQDTLPDMSAREIVKENVRLGENEIDLYVGERWLVGHFLDGSVLVRVGILTTDFENVSLDAFDMVPVASIK